MKGRDLVMDKDFAAIQTDKYRARVSVDGGNPGSRNIEAKLIRFYKSQGRWNDIKLLWSAVGGTLIQSGTNPLQVSKAYSADSNRNDLAQATSLNQPYGVGQIQGLPMGLYNPNGAARFMTHPAISFAADEAWSATTVLNWSGLNDFTALFSNNNSPTHQLSLRTNSPYFSYFNGTIRVTGTVSNNHLIGKIFILTIIADGLGSLRFYVNGILFDTISTSTQLIVNMILGVISGREYNGTIYHHKLQSGSLTASQVAAEYAMLRSIYPEIPSVVIGSQEWAVENFRAVATPMGNVIANVTENGAVEKNTDPAFEKTLNQSISTIGTYWRTFANTSIVSGKLIYDGLATGRLDTISDFPIIAGKWYKKTVIVTAGTVRMQVTASDNTGIGDTESIYPVGTTIAYFKATQSKTGVNYLFYTTNGGTAFEAESISLQELGWANATEIYDAVYAATSGTTAQKEYAALKEAAMWCSYNNDPANDSVYGKLYNWYAVKLLQDDIDAYNAANPSTPWGWRVPKSADFNTLATTLGGTAVAGGKMKMTGLDYWATPNTGADNSSGFSALGGSYRSSNGSFSLTLKYYSTFHITTIWAQFLRYNGSNLTTIGYATTPTELIGASLRLIKNS